MYIFISFFFFANLLTKPIFYLWFFQTFFNIFRKAKWQEKGNELNPVLLRKKQTKCRRKWSNTAQNNLKMMRASLRTATTSTSNKFSRCGQWRSVSSQSRFSNFFLFFKYFFIFSCVCSGDYSKTGKILKLINFKI